MDKALEELKEGEKKLAHRNKLILIVDSAEEGWEVVNKYQHRDLADDSDDDKRIRQAEARASQKRRHAQSQKKRPNFSQGSSFPQFSSAPRASSPVPLLQPSVFPKHLWNRVLSFIPVIGTRMPRASTLFVKTGERRIIG